MNIGVYTTKDRKYSCNILESTGKNVKIRIISGSKDKPIKFVKPEKVEIFL